MAISQGGTTYAATVSTLLNGTTIGQVEAANSPAETDTLLVAQGNDVLVRQNLGAIASWLSQRVSSDTPNVVVVSANTTIDPQVHNGKILVCTTSVNLSVPSSITKNFRCEVINLGGGDLTLASVIRTSSGSQLLPAGQGMRLYGLQYAGTSVIYAWVNNAATPAGSTIPGQPLLVSANATSSTSAQLVWTGPASAAQLTYTVNYRQSGTTTWSTADAGAGVTQCTVANLTTGISYEFGVAAWTVNAVGPLSNLVTVVMPTAGPVPVSLPVALTSTDVTTNAANVKWSAPSTGQAQSYLIEYRTVGANAWNPITTGGTVLNASLSGLVSGQAYEWRVTAVGVSGSSAVSAAATFTTLSAAPAVTAITWNVVQPGPFPKGVGAIVVNAHISPATSAVRYGLSSSSTVPPSAWVAASYVNTDLWGAYLGTPGVAGSYYAWGQGLDGSATTISSQVISVT